MKSVMRIAALVGMTGLMLHVAANVAAFDSRIATDTTLAPSDGLIWIDGAKMPLESKVCAETAQPYGRIPAAYADAVPDAVREMGKNSTGHYFLFQTDSSVLGVRWECEQTTATDPYIPPQGMYGVDIYVRVDAAEAQGLRTLDGGAAWRFLKNGRLGDASGKPYEQTSVDLPGCGLRAVMVYLPIRAHVKSVQIGIKEGAQIASWHHPSGIVKPVVHYGTSIVHGGCVSRPGLMFTSQAGRLVDVPYVNLGFSGSARLEAVMADVMACADASLYIVDPAWNCTAEMVNERAETFLRKLHALRPATPILLCEGGEPGGRLGSNDALAKVYAKLKAEGALDGTLHYLPAKGLIQKDGESTHDYCHPNDWGAMQMGLVFARKIRSILFASGRSGSLPGKSGFQSGRSGFQPL